MKEKLILISFLCLFSSLGSDVLRADPQAASKPAAKSPAKKEQPKNTDASEKKSAPAKPPMKSPPQPVEPLRSVTVRPAGNPSQARPSSAPARIGSKSKEEEDPEEARARASIERAVALTKELEAVIEAEDFQKFETICEAIENESRSVMTRQQGDEWAKLSRRLAEVQPVLQKKYMDFRLEQVAEFAKQVSKACLEGAEVIELEKLQLEAIGLSLDNSALRYQGGSTGPWQQRLKAANSLLSYWIAIQNFIDLGYTEQAIERVEYFMQSPREFPIVGRKDLDELIAKLRKAHKEFPDDPIELLEIKVYKVLHRLLKDVENPDADLLRQVAVEVAELYPLDMQGTQIAGEVRNLAEGFYNLSETRHRLDKGEDLQATYAIRARGEIKVFAPGYYTSIRTRMELEMIQRAYEEINAELPPREDETIEGYLFRLLTSKQAAGDAETRLRLLTSLGHLKHSRSRLPENIEQILKWHRDFVEAEVSGRSGNSENALKLYRTVAVEAQESFGLAELAESRIADLKKAEPEIFVSQNRKTAAEVYELNRAVKAMAKEIAALKKVIEASK